MSVREIAKSLAGDLLPRGYDELAILKIERALILAQMEALNDFENKILRARFAAVLA